MRCYVSGCALVLSLLVTIGLGEERQLFGSDGLNIPSIQEGNDAVFNTVNQIFGALRIPLNVRNPFRRSQATDRGKILLTNLQVETYPRLLTSTNPC